MKVFSALRVVALIITPSVVNSGGPGPNRCSDCCPVQCCTRNLTVFLSQTLGKDFFLSCSPENNQGCARPVTALIRNCPNGFEKCRCSSECFARKKLRIFSEPSCNGQNPAQEVFSRRRRLDGVLMELDNYDELDNFGWEEYKHKCNSFSYELRLYVDWHLMLLVVPDDNEAVAVGCGPLALHSTNHHNGTWGKQALLFDKSRFEEFNTMKKDSIVLHSHQFSDIAVAYELAEAAGTSTDVVLNNCGDFAKNFCAIVGEKFTPAMTMDIARRLIEKSDGAIVRKIHSSDHVRTLVVEGGGDSDEELVYRLVESRTRELYNL